MPSTALTDSYYNENSGILTITYISGAVYNYLRVPKSVYDEFKAATSKGQFVNFQIKPNYIYEKVTEGH